MQALLEDCFVSLQFDFQWNPSGLRAAPTKFIITRSEPWDPALQSEWGMVKARDLHDQGVHPHRLIHWDVMISQQWLGCHHPNHCRRNGWLEGPQQDPVITQASEVKPIYCSRYRTRHRNFLRYSWRYLFDIVNRVLWNWGFPLIL